MPILLFVFAASLVLACLSARYCPADGLPGDRHFALRRADPFCALLILVFTLFAGLRVAYNDTETYIRLYRDGAVGLAAFLQSGEIGPQKSPLFYGLQAVGRSLINSYRLWFLFVGWFSARQAVLFCREYSVDLPFSILLYQAIGAEVFSFAAMRQGAAIAVLMLAVPFLLRRRWLPYYLLVAAAALLHVYAAVFLLLPLFLRHPWGWGTVLFLALCAAAGMAYRPVFARLGELASLAGIALPETELFDPHTVHPLRVLVYAVPAVFSFVFRDRLFRDADDCGNLTVNMSIVSAGVLAVGLAGGANLFGRMASYFEWGVPVAVPWMLGQVFGERSRKRVTLLAALFYTAYFIFDFAVSKDFGGTYRAASLMELAESVRNAFVP